MKVLQISTGYTDGSVEKGLIEAAGGSYTLISSEREQDIIAAGQDATVLLVALTEVSGTVIRALKQLKLIVRAGIGVDNIDLAAVGIGNRIGTHPQGWPKPLGTGHFGPNLNPPQKSAASMCAIFRPIATMKWPTIPSHC